MPGAPLLPDWEMDTVLLIPPARHMEVYDAHLTRLQSFYEAFACEAAKHDQTICVVDPAEPAPECGAPYPLYRRQGRIGDIWVRDFAPVPSRDGLTAFIYEPDYVPLRHSRRAQQALLALIERDPVLRETGPIVHLDLRLDGGNLVHNGAGIAIVSDKVLSCNKDKSRRDIERMMKDALALERLVIVPCEPGDPFGHTDGMLRWVDEKRLILNDYLADASMRGFANDLMRILDRELGTVERHIVPYPITDRVYRGWPDAAGNYVNFLRTGHRVYVPLYGLPEDAEAIAIFNDLFAGQVSGVYPRELSRYGGVLNCISWTVRTTAGAEHP